MKTKQYQTFDLPNIKSELPERISDLRKELSSYDMDGIIVPYTDPYQSEYLPDCYKRLEYITGFTGSWGLSFILQDKAVLFVDSRYKIQAKDQTDTNIFDVVCISDTPINEYLTKFLDEKYKIAFDPHLLTKKQIDNYQKDNNAEFIPLEENIIDKIWINRPELILSDINTYPLEFAGKKSEEKIADIAKIIRDKKQDALIVGLPESICWLLNVRAKDVLHTPLVLCRAIITSSGRVLWYIGKERLNEDLLNHLSNIVTISEVEDFAFDIKKYNKIWVDPDVTSYFIEDKLDKFGANIFGSDDPILLQKAIKNKTEQKSTDQAHKIDAIAMIYFMKWFEEQKAGDFTEIDCVKALEYFRKKSDELQDISFDTIAGSGENGAIVHYRVTNMSNRAINDGDLFLCDSGGQYIGGTTDITRVFIKGTPTYEMKKRYTQVLKGHLALSNAIFPKNTIGSCLDGIARAPLWEAGIDFGHGTGHGVGVYLSVHEGPQSISPRSKIPLKAGMLISNEPGYYKEGEFGIRIENVEMIVENNSDSFETEMLGLKTLTLVPYEIDLIDIDILTPKEIEQINRYHQRILDDINIPIDIADFLNKKCEKI